MKVDIAGKVRNTVLPRSKPLLPVFEAVVNSLQALEELPSVTEVPHIDSLFDIGPASASAPLSAPDADDEEELLTEAGDDEPADEPDDLDEAA